MSLTKVKRGVSEGLLPEVATIAALEAIASPENGMSVQVTDTDRGGLFVFDTSATAAANNGTTFTADDATTGSWVRQYSGAIYLQWFNVVGDGDADDADGIQAAIDFAVSISTNNNRATIISWPEATHYCSKYLHILENVIFDGANCLFTADGAADNYGASDALFYLGELRTEEGGLAVGGVSRNRPELHNVNFPQTQIVGDPLTDDLSDDANFPAANLSMLAYCKDAYRSVVAGCRVENSRNWGIGIAGGEGNIVERCFIKNIRFHGVGSSTLFTGNPMKNVTVRFNRIENTAGNAVNAHTRSGTTRVYENEIINCSFLCKNQDTGGRLEFYNNHGSVLYRNNASTECMSNVDCVHGNHFTGLHSLMNLTDDPRMHYISNNVFYARGYEEDSAVLGGSLEIRGIGGSRVHVEGNEFYAQGLSLSIINGLSNSSLGAPALSEVVFDNNKVFARLAAQTNRRVIDVRYVESTGYVRVANNIFDVSGTAESGQECVSIRDCQNFDLNGNRYFTTNLNFDVAVQNSNDGSVHNETCGGNFFVGTVAAGNDPWQWANRVSGTSTGVSETFSRPA